MLTREEFDAMLAASIEDRKVTRSERRALREILAEQDLDARERDLLRSRAFAAAAGELDTPRAKEVVGWLADIVGLLKPAAAGPADPAASIAYFGPHDDCAGKIVRLFDDARERVDVCVFTITDNRITRAVEKAHRRGVKLRIVTDDEKSGDRGSDIERLVAAGVSVVADDTEDHMHHKFAMFDRASLLTGSYNWTRSAADHNHENFIVTGDRRLLRAFSAEFERLWTRYS